MFFSGFAVIRRAVLSLVLLLCIGAPTRAFGQSASEANVADTSNIEADTSNTTIVPPTSAAAVWRMPPMNVEMPMIPGLGGATPSVHPFLPGRGLSAENLPKARPREVVEMADGDTLDLEATLVRRTIKGRPFKMYGYNGQYPGPLIKVDQGTEVIVRFKNNIDIPTTIHWHGVRIDNRYDGMPFVTQKPVEVGGAFIYKVQFPDAGVYWYHPHVREDIEQDLGLYGNMIVKPSKKGYYSPVNREEDLILDDILIDKKGLLPWGREASINTLMGRFGNVMLLNGGNDYELSVKKGAVVRFYLTNVANTRTFNLTFGGNPIKMVADDIGKFEHEKRVRSVPIGVAERYTVEVRFDEPGRVPITNSIRAINHFRGEFYPRVDTLGFVNVSSEPVDTSYAKSFTHLRENEDVEEDIADYRPFFDQPVDHRLELTVEHEGLPVPIVRSMEVDTLYVPPIEWNDTMPMMNWLSSGAEVSWVLRDLDTGKENRDIDWRFEKGEVAKLRLFNNPRAFHPMNHPIHLHGERFLVLSTDGKPNQNLAWQETVIVPVGSTMDILVDMSNPGDWMLHCHIAEHLESGMSLVFHVNGKDGTLSKGAGDAHDVSHSHSHDH